MWRKICGVMMILTCVFVFVLLGCAAPVGTVPALLEQPVPGPLPYTPGRHPVH